MSRDTHDGLSVSIIKARRASFYFNQPCIARQSSSHTVSACPAILQGWACCLQVYDTSRSRQTTLRLKIFLCSWHSRGCHRIRQDAASYYPSCTIRIVFHKIASWIPACTLIRRHVNRCFLRSDSLQLFTLV